MKNSRNTAAKILPCIAFALLLGSAVQAQPLKPDKVPELVTKAFSFEFPKAEKAEWKMDGPRYMVDFETGADHAHHEGWFDANGRFLKHVEEIDFEDLPLKLQGTINKEFPEFNTSGIQRVEEDGTTSFVIELKAGDTEQTVIYAADGMQLQKLP